MSEYQFFEWQAVDRPLTEAEQEAVGRLSSHIEVSDRRAVVTYSWGDFKHDSRQVLAEHFDAHLYMANWGSNRLMFRFAAGLLAHDSIEPFCVQDRIGFMRVAGFDILDMDLSEEEGGGWIEAGGSLSGLLPLRNDILQGDHRALYLAWLKAISLQPDEPPHHGRSGKSKRAPPAIPPGLRQLSPALRHFLRQFAVPSSLVEAAAELSPEVTVIPDSQFHSLVAQLSREECDRFLCRVACGDATAGFELNKRLRSLMAAPPSAAPARRSASELLARAEEIEIARQARQKEEARRKHAAEMEAMADREADIWEEIESLVSRKQSKHYDAAIRLLAGLRQLADFRGSLQDFRKQLSALSDRHRNRPSFLSRIRCARLSEAERSTELRDEGESI